MSSCAVLRCDAPATTIGPLATTSEVNQSTTVELCERHRAEIDSGEVDWRWESEDRRILMHPDDLAGDHMWLWKGLVHLQTSSSLERSSKPDYTDVLHLVLRRWGSTEEDDFHLMLSREELAHLRDSIDRFLRMVG
jgi:hypothetical protein